MDCSNNGICEATEDAEKAVCLCQNGFKGPNCEGKQFSLSALRENFIFRQ